MDQYFTKYKIIPIPNPNPKVMVTLEPYKCNTET